MKIATTCPLLYKWCLLISVLLAILGTSGCGQSPDKPVIMTADEPIPYDTGYSDLTRQETEATLKRLRSIRRALQNEKPGRYTGPIRHIWDRIRASRQIAYEDNLRIEHQATIMLRSPAYLKRTSRRASPFIHYIAEALKKRGMPGELALLPVIESAYRPTAVSKSRAVGLWQFIPSTSKFLGMHKDWWYDGRRDVIHATKYALDYLQTINKKFNGDWLLTLAAYNAGHGRVSRAIDKNRRQGKPTDYWNLQLPSETMDYVPRFLAVTQLFTRAEDYNLELHLVANKPGFEIVGIKDQLNIKLAARMAGIDIAKFRNLNAGYLRRATPPGRSHRILLPVGKKHQFSRKLASFRKEQKTRWVQHRVKADESLTRIALHYGIPIHELKKTNNLEDSLIHPGEILRIPMRYATKNNKQKEHGKPNNSSIYYTVRRGDTLWKIARKHNITLKMLRSLNNLSTHAIIYPGQRLLVGHTKNNKIALGTPMPHYPFH